MFFTWYTKFSIARALNKYLNIAMVYVVSFYFADRHGLIACLYHRNKVFHRRISPA